jgi:hypothetical protein
VHRPVARLGGLLLAATVVATLGAAPAAAVSGGAPAEPGAYPFLARIAVGDDRSCTGSLVEAQWLLTAADCFADAGRPATAGPPPRPTTAVIGRDAASTGQTLPVAELRPYAGRDLVLARLALRTSGITPVLIDATAPAAGDLLRAAGYGRTGTEWVPDRPHTATFTVRAVTPTTLDIAGTDPDRTSTCKGDAGGPALRESGAGVQLVAVHSLSWQHGCLGVTQDQTGSIEARADDLAEWVRLATRPPATAFTTSYVSQGGGIGTFDLLDARDQVVAFDYTGSGRQDHLLLYRPGAGIAYVVKRSGNAYVRVFSSADGIGGFDLRNAADRVVPFDYNGTGKLDHLVAYRPGYGTAYIVKKGAGNTFTRVSASSTGLGTFDLRNAADQVVAFDYAGTGRRDHLLLYRPGAGIAYVVRRSGTTMVNVFASHAGIGGFDLSDARDRAVPYDYDGSGRADHLVFYRPGAGSVAIVERSGSAFARVFGSGTGIGGYSLADNRDQLVAYDYEQTGRPDHLIAYRPGVGAAYLLKRSGTTFTRVSTSMAGLGGFDLKVARDRIVPFDDEGAGSPLQLLVYRPGNGIAYVMGRFRPPAD